MTMTMTVTEKQDTYPLLKSYYLNWTWIYSSSNMNLNLPYSTTESRYSYMYVWLNKTYMGIPIVHYRLPK